MTSDLFDDPEHVEAVRCLADVPPVPPSPVLLGSILDRIELEAAQPGFVFRTADTDKFKPTTQPGVTIRLLHTDRLSNRFSAYLRLEPGASLHPHAHEGVEECVVLSGSVRVGDRLLTAGDYQRAEPGHDHGEQTSPDGCLLFLTGPLSLLGE